MTTAGGAGKNPPRRFRGDFASGEAPQRVWPVRERNVRPLLSVLCSLSDNVAPAPSFRSKAGIDALGPRISIAREAWLRRSRKMQAKFPVPKPPVTQRPATEADFITMFGKPPQHRVRALAAEIDGRLVGLGGLALIMPGESWVCFMRATDEFRARPIALHRAGLRMMDEARRLRIRRLVALAEPGIEPAERWLRRFGFAPEEIDGQTVWVCNEVL